MRKKIILTRGNKTVSQTPQGNSIDQLIVYLLKELATKTGRFQSLFEKPLVNIESLVPSIQSH